MVVEFAEYLYYCKSLRFEDRPDYGLLRNAFKDLMSRENMQYDFVFDWTITENMKKMYLDSTQKSTFSTMHIGSRRQSINEDFQGVIIEQENEENKNVETFDVKAWEKNNVAKVEEEEKEDEDIESGNSKESENDAIKDNKPGKTMPFEGTTEGEPKEDASVNTKTPAKPTLKDMYKQEGNVHYS